MILGGRHAEAPVRAAALAIASQSTTARRRTTFPGRPWQRPTGREDL